MHKNVVSISELLINSKITGLFSIKVKIIDSLILRALEAYFLCPKGRFTLEFFSQLKKKIL